MQSVSDDDVWKRLLEKPRFDLAAEAVLFRLGRCYKLNRYVNNHPSVAGYTYRDGLLVCRQSPIQVVTGLGVEQLR